MADTWVGVTTHLHMCIYRFLSGLLVLDGFSFSYLFFLTYVHVHKTTHCTHCWWTYCILNVGPWYYADRLIICTLCWQINWTSMSSSCSGQYSSKAKHPSSPASQFTAIVTRWLRLVRDSQARPQTERAATFSCKTTGYCTRCVSVCVCVLCVLCVCVFVKGCTHGIAFFCRVSSVLEHAIDCAAALPAKSS